MLVRFRAVHLGGGRHPLEGHGPATFLPAVSAVRRALLAHGDSGPIVISHRNGASSTVTSLPSPQRKPGCGRAGQLNTSFPWLPQPLAIHRNVGRRAGTPASPPQPERFHRNPRKSTAAKSHVAVDLRYLPQPRLIHRNQKWSTATRRIDERCSWDRWRPRRHVRRNRRNAGNYKEEGRPLSPDSQAVAPRAEKHYRLPESHRCLTDGLCRDGETLCRLSPRHRRPPKEFGASPQRFGVSPKAIAVTRDRFPEAAKRFDVTPKLIRASPKAIGVSRNPLASCRNPSASLRSLSACPRNLSASHGWARGRRR
jgi:hypothetical protein